MKLIEYKAGWFYLKGFEEDEIPEWVTSDYNGGFPYFHLNIISREKFKRDIVPLLRAKEVSIRKQDYARIRDYSPVELAPTDPKPLPLDLDGVTLDDYQTKAIGLMHKYKKYGLFLGTGSGKTLIALGFLKSCPWIQNVLIVTPLKVISQYEKAIAQYYPTLDYKIVNFESLHKHEGQKYSCVIIDESHKAKSYTSKANKQLRALCHGVDRVYLFTGTPQDKARHELFPQLAILDSDIMPGKSRFFHRYFRLDDYYNPKSERKNLSNELTGMIRTLTWGAKAEALYTLPDEVTEIVEVEKPFAYDKLLKELHLSEEEFGSLCEEPIDPRVVIADIPATLRIKLRQLCNGHLTFDRHLKSLRVCKDTLYLNHNKCVQLGKLLRDVPRALIFTTFRADETLITELLSENHLTFGLINGETKDVGAVTDKFAEGSIDYLVINAACGSSGLHLVHTNNTIFYSLPESFIQYEQCKARTRRRGQPMNECNYYYLLCKGTVDVDIYNSLNRKKSYTNKLFSAYIRRDT